MTRLRVWMSRTLDVVLRRRRDDRLSEEIDTHLDLLAAEHVARGMSPSEARLAARRAFGGVEPMKEAYRDQRGMPGLDSLVQDIRFAARLLWRDPGFAASAVAVLALGIGVNNMLFTILNAHTIRGLPIRAAEEVVYLTTMSDRAPDLRVSFHDFVDWQAKARSFTTMAAFANNPVVLAGDGRAAETLTGTFVSSTAFQLVGTQPILGRDFTPADDAPGAAAVVLMGASTWESRYARDPGIVGRAITVNGAPAVVIGVVPERSGFPTSGQVWLPLSMIPALRDQPRDARTLNVIARLNTGTDVPRARAEIESIASQLAAEHPTTNAKVRARLVPIDEQYQGSISHPAWRAFIGVSIIVVLISCANAANLMLARSLGRAREIAIRTSLGASRRRVVRQLLIEGATLAMLGGALGLVVANLGLKLFTLGIPRGALPYWVEYTPDGRVISALVAVSAATVFIFALLPAIQGSKADVTLVLKDGGRSSTAQRSRRWSTVFLAAEFGLAVVLLASFIANVRTRTPAVASDKALATSSVLTAEISLPEATYGSVERRSQFYAALGDRLKTVPTIASVSLATALPLNGGETRGLDIDGRPRRDPKEQETVTSLAVSPGYFATLGLSLIRGREFSDEDGAAGMPSVIINERFVERFLGVSDPIGQRIAVTPMQSTDPPVWLTITGVAPSVRQRVTPNADASVYLPFRSSPAADAALLVRSTSSTQALADTLRTELQAIDPTLPLDQVRTMQQVVRDAEWVGRTSRNLSDALTFIAVLLAALGLYAVTSYAVSQRTQEIGIRIALGARRWQVAMFVGRGIAAHLAIGLATGVVCTRIWAWMFSSGRAGVTASDVLPLVGVAGILIAIAVVACFVPVRRATRLDPVIALRRE
jgi:putative ABC transport system permease protein